MMIHLWLLLFAFGALVIPLLRRLSQAVRWTQWFISHGDQHPLDAVGMVGAVVMFVFVAIIQAAVIF